MATTYMDGLARFSTYLLWTLSFVWPLWLPAVAWLAYGTVRGRRTGRPLDELWVLVAAPLAVVAWGALAYAWGERQDGGQGPQWPFLVLHAVALLQGGLAVALARRHRSAGRFVLPTALAALAFTAMAWFVGAMSIANDWI